MTDPTLPPVGAEDGYDAAGATSGAGVLRGGMWSSFSRVLPQSYVLIQSAVAARYLGVDGMGRQSFIGFVQLSLTLLFGLGLNGALVRYVAETLGQRRSEAARGLVNWVLRVELVAAAVGLGVFAIIGAFSSDLRTAWLLAGVACAFGVLNHVPYAVLSGAQRWREFAIISLVVGTVGTSSTVAILALGGGITGIFAVQAVVTAFSLLWTTSLCRKTLREVAPRSGPTGDLRRKMIRFAAVNWLGFALSLIVWRRSEFFFLARYSTDTQIGLYSVSFAAVAALVSSLDAISMVIAPAVATLSGAGAEERIRSGFSRAVRLVLYLTLPMTAGALAVGPAALRVIYGSSYRGAASPLLIMLVIFPTLPLLNLASSMLWGLGRVKTWLIVCAFASVVNLSLDFILIPHFGATGAALANSGAQVSAAVAIVISACRSVGPVNWQVPALVRSSVAALAAGVAGWLGVSWVSGPLGVLAGIAGGLVAYAFTAAQVRVLPRDDAAWLEASFGKYLGGRVGRALRRFSPDEPDGEGTATDPHQEEPPTVRVP